MSSSPLVSVVLPVFNAARYLRAALASLRRQTAGDFEIIAVNDGSTDDSLAQLRAGARIEPRLHVLTQPNTGIVGALNAGLAAARGEFIARMDADDIALPARFAAQLAHLRAEPACLAVGTDVFYTDPEGERLVRHRPPLDHDGIVAQLLDGNGGALIHPTLMARRAALVALGGHRARFDFIEDLDLYLRLAGRGRLANLPAVHLHYRQHALSVNRTRGDRHALRCAIVNPYRRAAGLGDLPAAPELLDAPLSTADWRRHWAFDAARGRQWKAARKNAGLASLAAPFDLRNWQCFNYTLGAAVTAADS
jgi:glycosyltransferase involved in cell wall biosynthesis